ncbi:MAG TPA: hypothetical protein VGN81_40225 [Pseudonocardiaceae bacterium]|jgi:hypothetical protein
MDAVALDGNVFAWPEGHVTLPLAEVPLADTTGGGPDLSPSVVDAQL